MFTGEIDAYILSHIDEEGAFAVGVNRDANVTFSVRVCYPGICRVGY